MKPLIVYYSRPGKNLVDGVVRDLRIGNTELAATILQKLTRGELFRLEPEKDYSSDYYRCIDQARQDLQKRRYPKLKRLPEHLADYPVIYLGYPNYWGTMPMPVFSFLKKCDLSGKQIWPFCTHEGGGMGRSEADLQILCPKSHIERGLAIRGTAVRQSIKQIEQWAASGWCDSITETQIQNEKETNQNEKKS